MSKKWNVAAVVLAGVLAAGSGAAAFAGDQVITIPKDKWEELVRTHKISVEKWERLIRPNHFHFERLETREVGAYSQEMRTPAVSNVLSRIGMLSKTKREVVRHILNSPDKSIHEIREQVLQSEDPQSALRTEFETMSEAELQAYQDIMNLMRSEE